MKSSATLSLRFDPALILSPDSPYHDPDSSKLCVHHIYQDSFALQVPQYLLQMWSHGNSAAQSSKCHMFQ